MEQYRKEDLLRVAQSSPEAVAEHDKQVWLSLFASRCVIEDPVGTAPHRRSDGDDGQLDRFYETFIAPNKIKFHVYQDIVTNNAVMRDVNIEIESSSGMTSNVPTYVLYEIVEENGSLKVARLAAHWELCSMVKRVISQGWPGLKMTTRLSFRMLGVQGFKGVWGYTKGFSGIGGGGKNTVLSFVEALNSGDAARLVDLFVPHNGAIEFPVADEKLSPQSFANSTSMQISVSDLISAGMITAFRFEATDKGSVENGIGLFKFDKKINKIINVQFFK